MGIEQMYERLRAEMAGFGRQNGYAPSVHPLSFDGEPHAGQTAYYVDPPRLRVAGHVGGALNVIATFTVWLSRDAGDQATGGVQYPSMVASRSPATAVSYRDGGS